MLRYLIMAAASVAIPSAGAAQSCPPMETRAMSYNIRLDVTSDGLNAWPHRRSELIGQVKLIRPDLLGLQEVVPGQRRDLIAGLEDYEFVGVARDDGRDSGEYSPIGVSRSQFQILGSGTFWLSQTPETPSRGWDAAYPRIVTWARLKHIPSGSSLLALNTHWDHEGRSARTNSAALINSWIMKNRRPDELLLVMGDFNAPLTEPSMQQLIAGGLSDSRSSASPLSYGPSTSFNNFQLIAPEGEAIDHVLTGRGLKAIRHWTIAQHVDGRPISDHYPVVADLAGPSPDCR